MSTKPFKVCIIGAGVSGLTSIKACLEENLTPICFEATDDIGGVWRFTTTNEEKASVMKSTVINTSKEFMAFSDFPPDKDLPNYMSHYKIMDYLRSYTEHFDLLRYIQFHTKITSVKKAPDFERKQQYCVNTVCNGDTQEHIFDAVMVCSGHHCYPYQPKFEGLDQFPGKVMHTHECRDAVADGFKDQRCLVIGLGNSGTDFAVEASHVSSAVFLSTRRGAWFMARVWDNGMPADLVVIRRSLAYMVKILGQNAINMYIMNQLNGRFDHALYGLKPAHKPLQQHINVCDDIPNRILSGKIVIKPNIKRFLPPLSPDDSGAPVEFEDGTIEKNISCVIIATGYTISFPFLDDDLFSTKENELHLYKLVYPTNQNEHPTMAFIGYIQPIGAIQPIAELQARWAVRVFTKKTALPDTVKMEKCVKERREAMNKRYVTSRRHTIQVDHVDYVDDLATEAGCMPNLPLLWLSDPVLAYRLTFGPYTHYQFRMFGTHRWSGARQALWTQNERIMAPLSTRQVANNTTKSSWFLYLSLFVVFISLFYSFFLK